MGILIAIATSGYVVLSVYKTFYKTQFNEQNTYQTLFTCLIFGLIPYAIYNAFHSITYPPTWLIELIPQLSFLKSEYMMSDSAFKVYEVINIGISTYIATKLITVVDIHQKLKDIRKKLLKNNNRSMDLNMLTEMDFDEIRSNYQKIFIQLKDGAVIVGFVEFADFADIVPSDLRIIKIKVLKSGYRDKSNLEEINFTTNYEKLALEKYLSQIENDKSEKTSPTEAEPEAEAEDEKAKKDEQEAEDNQLRAEYLNRYMPMYSIFQREIKYYSIFNPDIDAHFQED